jgi:hypothetical protein
MNDEALKLALEALEIQAYNSGDEKYTQAITAIKQALAAQPAPVQELQRYSPDGEGGMEVDSLGAYVKLQDVTTPPAAPALQAELDATNRQVEILSDALAESRREVAALVQPVVWEWHQAPVKTSWGHDMVVADLAIDKDNTVSIYCERDQTTKVEAMFSTPPAAQRTWVGLKDPDFSGKPNTPDFIAGAFFAEAILKEKNI